MITLADATPDDADAIAALCAELAEFYGGALQGTAGERAAQIRAVLAGDPPIARILLAWDGPRPAGFASYTFLWPAAGLTASLYLKELYVSAACRRSGSGKLLMDRLYAIAAERGCSRVEWTTDTSNRDAQAFYEALGAKPLPSKIFYRVTR
ncbi:MAG: GNAT family N-acetyltransferase [Trebonia sp.]